MRHKKLADGILAASAALALASAPWAEGSPAVGAVFHISFASAVAGFADWFGVTSLFRKPLGIPWRTDLIARNREKIAAMAKDMVMNELLTTRRMKALLIGHPPSVVAAHWMGRNREGLRRLLLTAAEILISAVPREWLWEALSGHLSAAATKMDWARTLASLMGAFQNYDRKDALLAVLSREAKGFLQDEFTLEEIRRVYLLAWEDYQAGGMLRGFFRSAVEDRDEEIIAALQQKIFSLADELTNPESDLTRAMAKSYEEMERRLTEDEALRRKVNENISRGLLRLLQGKGREWFLQTFQDNEENFAVRLTDGLLALAEDMLADEKKRRDFDAFLLRLLLPRVEMLHRMAGKVVETALAAYDGRALARLAEEGAGEDVAMIRINGSLMGALLGGLFYGLTLLGGAL